MSKKQNWHLGPPVASPPRINIGLHWQQSHLQISSKYELHHVNHVDHLLASPSLVAKFGMGCSVEKYSPENQLRNTCEKCIWQSWHQDHLWLPLSCCWICNGLFCWEIQSRKPAEKYMWEMHLAKIDTGSTCGFPTLCYIWDRSYSW